MTTVNKPRIEPEETSEEAIADYLTAHPDFFERHSKVLSALQIPHQTGGPAVSLVERQVAVLRQSNLKLERKLRELLDVARSNDQLADKIHTLAVQLMTVPNRQAVISIVEESLRSVFSADHAVLVLFQGDGLDPASAKRFLRIIDRQNPALSPFKTFLETTTPRCGRIRDSQQEFLFGPDNVEIGSVALVPLGERSSIGFMAIGNRDAEYFHPGKSMDFLARLGDLIGCALASG